MDNYVGLRISYCLPLCVNVVKYTVDKVEPSVKKRFKTVFLNEFSLSSKMLVAHGYSACLVRLSAVYSLQPKSVYFKWQTST